MLLLLLLSPLAAAERPTQAVLDDVARWEAGQDALLAGPPGCWDLVGDVRQVATLHQPPDFFSAPRNEAFPMEGTVSGRLVDGRWTGPLTHDLKPDGHELDLTVPVYPLFGAMPEGAHKGQQGQVSVGVGGGEPQVAGSLGSSVNVLREAVDKWSGSFESALVQWDDEGEAVVLLRQIALSDSDPRPIDVTVRFPDAGPADRIDAVWPRLIKLGTWPFRVKIRDAQMHAVGYAHEGKVIPWAESLSFVAGAVGYTVGFEQKVTWRQATPCVPPQ